MGKSRCFIMALCLVAGSAWSDHAAAYDINPYTNSPCVGLGCLSFRQSPSSPGNSGGSSSRRSYAAIAATKTDGDFYGISYGHGSRGQAEAEAIRQCEAQAGRPDACEIATWFYNECGALALASNGGWGADWSGSTAAAARKAMARCQQSNTDGSCHIVKTFCSR